MSSEQVQHLKGDCLHMNLLLLQVLGPEVKLFIVVRKLDLMFCIHWAENRDKCRFNELKELIQIGTP